MYDFSFIKGFLENQGYKVQEFPNYLKCAALYRGGDNETAVTVYPDLIIDHVTSDKYSYKDFLVKVLGLDNKDKLNEYLEQNGAVIENKNKSIEEPLIKSTKVQNQDFLLKLDKSDKAQEYWINRGISLEVLKEFQGGRYKDRYYFPIFSENGKDLMGWNSRDLTDKSIRKYQLKGSKKEFLYPLFINKKDVEEKGEVYLVEGVGCCLKLFSCGIRNVIVMFGCECSYTIVNKLLKLNNPKIFICTDNDLAGQEASKKIYSRLHKYFDLANLYIKYPNKKDFGEMTNPEILEWVK